MLHGLRRLFVGVCASVCVYVLHVLCMGMCVVFYGVGGCCCLKYVGVFVCDLVLVCVC